MARLPRTPEGHELEDFVAALFQTAGYFVEKRIEEKNVLDLDVVVTAYADKNALPLIVEVKSGEWGFKEVFKFLGQMTYLRLPRGVFVVREAKRDTDVVKKKFSHLGIDVLHLGKLEEAHKALEEVGFPPMRDKLAFSVWRYSFWLERLLLEVLRSGRRASPSVRFFNEALHYYELVNDGVFFTADVVDRVSKLYDAFRAHPKLSLAAASELGTGNYDPNARGKNRFFAQAIRGRHPEIQACWYVEHRARLSIFKAAVDYILLKEEGLPLPKKDGWPILLYELLPKNFRDGVEWLREQQNYRFYPVLWQIFIWGWGGFLLQDRAREEYTELANQSGVPAEEVPVALQAFDRLFASDEGWFAPIRDSEVQALKLVPVYFRGLGSFQRLRRHGAEHYSQLGYKSGSLTDYLLNVWHSSTYRFLPPDVPEDQG